MVQLLVESWTWWAVVLFVGLSRFIGRRMTLGSFRRFQADDWGMAIVLMFYTALIATINIVANANSNLLPPGFDVNSLTAQDIEERSYGSKLILVVEQCQCVVIWGAKSCLIILYLRLTTMRIENICIKVLAGYVAITFLVMEILYFGVWCQPFWEYWAVPTNNIQCSAATNHLITNAVFNLTSDCAMLTIGLPMFIRMHLPWQKKFPLVLIFSLGIFVILAAILNKVYSFTEPFGSAWTYWYVRESSTALLVANLPFVWTLWRRALGVPLTAEHSGQSTSYLDGGGSNDPIGRKESPQSLRTDCESRDAYNDLKIRDHCSPPVVDDSCELTLDEILQTEQRSDVYDRHATPITHPWLFSRRNPAGPAIGAERSSHTRTPFTQAVQERW